MQILNRYIRSQLLLNYLLVNVLLLGLFGFIDLAIQLEDVGKGSFGTREAVLYTLYHLPRRTIDLFPFAALLASVLVLGAMAANRELVVMRGGGLSPTRIAGSLLKAGGWLLAAIIALELLVAPGLQQRAFQLRVTTVAGNSNQDDSAIWAKSGDGVVYIGSLKHGRIPTNVEIYDLGAKQTLRNYVHADTADITNPDRWLLHNVTVKNFADSSDSYTKTQETMDWRPILSPAQLKVLDRPADSLAVVDLYRYVHYLRAQGQNAQRFNLSLWQKLSMPITALAMILLAAPLSFVNPRGSNLGLRVVIGAGIGLTVFAITQISANLGLLYNLNAPLLTLVPGALLIIVALFWLRRLT